jgi:pSer/pThr/pTyr-binding forkhead associated (FHA) protein
MAKLKITDENGKERVHELVDDVTTIGRSSASTIQVTDEKASRSHFRVEKEGDRFKLVDLGSTNGTRLNGQKVQGTVFLRMNDRISLGRTTFVYDGPGAPAAAIEGGDTVPLDPIALNGPSTDGPKYVLKVLEGSNSGQQYELGPKPLTLGRHSSNTIQIVDDAASNYHAEVNREPIGFVLTDLGSTNGTRVKMKNKNDFEKVIKTPLSAGMQIKVGKTLLEFANVGKAEDELFATMALDPDKLEDTLSPPSSGTPKIAIAALLGLVLIGGGVFAYIKMNKPAEPGVKPTVPEVVDTTNRVINGDFSQGTDDYGNPKNFKIERGIPDVKVAVVPEADHAAGEAAPPPTPNPNPAVPKPPEKTKLGLQITKAGRTPSALTSVETAASFPVDPSKVYEISGWMRNDGDGLFGLRVTWIAGERTYSENPVVLKDTQEWKTKGTPLAPPSWAQRAKVGVFVQGKEGKASFDDLAFVEKPGAKVSSAPGVKFQSVNFSFEGTKGVFSASSQGDRVIEGGTLALITRDGAATSELTSAVEPQPSGDSAKTAIDGRLYDFALQDLTNYRIVAQPGSAGVDLKVAVDSASDTASKPELRFYVVGPAAQGDVEVTKSGNASDRMAAADGEKQFSDVQEVLFNAGKTPQFDLAFPKPVSLEIKREGARRKVTIQFKGEVQLAFAPESIVRKQQMVAAAADIRKSMEAKKWGDVEAKTKTFSDCFGSQFAQAKDEVASIREKIDAEWKDTQTKVGQAIEALKLVQTPKVIETSKETISRHIQMWTPGDHVTELEEKLKLIDELAKAGGVAKAEEEAEKMYTEAERYFGNRAYTVAISILKKKILEDAAGQKTKAAEKAKDLLAKAEAAEQRQQELNAISARLREKSKNYLLTNDFKGAVDAIEKDKEYQDNRADLKAIEDLLKDWKSKLK